MKINDLTNSAFVKNSQGVSKTPTQKSVGATKIEDKIEISKEAKNKLHEMDRQKIESIRAKIANGHYDSDDVINKVADKILSEIKSPKE